MNFLLIEVKTCMWVSGLSCKNGTTLQLECSSKMMILRWSNRTFFKTFTLFSTFILILKSKQRSFWFLTVMPHCQPHLTVFSSITLWWLHIAYLTFSSKPALMWFSSSSIYRLASWCLWTFYWPHINVYVCATSLWILLSPVSYTHLTLPTIYSV